MAVETANSPSEKSSKSEPLMAAIAAKAAVHGNGLMGGIALKATKLGPLNKVLAQPDGRERLEKAVRLCVQQAMDKAGIVYGVQDDEILTAATQFVDHAAAGKDDVVTRKIAEGEAPEAGESARIEYSLNYRGRPLRELAKLDRGSTRKKCTVVHREDVLATLHPAAAPKKGTSVTGDTLALAEKAAKSVGLEEVAGDNTQVSGNNLVSTCSGMCEENVDGHLRVVPEIVVDRVDAATGRVPESGVTQSHVLVREAIKGEGVATEENLFVGASPQGGSIEGKASVQAKNLALNGRLVGDSEGHKTTLEVEELCAVGEVMNRTVQARYILVARDSHFARLEAHEGVWVDGNLRGGQVKCRDYLQVAGDLGTDTGGSNTHVSLVPGTAGERQKHRMNAKVKAYRDQLQGLQSQLGTLDGHADKRGKADAYWATLLEGKRQPPQGALQQRTLLQFVEYVDQKRKLGREIKNIKETLVRLLVQKKEMDDEAGAESLEMTVVVGGTLWTDVIFEIVREVGGEDDEETKFSYKFDETTYSNTTLDKARSLLGKQVQAYLEKQRTALGEKQEALDKMFEGRDHKPSGPQLKDEVFELPVVMTNASTSPAFEVTSTLSVHALEPQKFVVQHVAHLREPMQNVVVRLQAQGVKGEFATAEPTEEVTRWMDLETVRDDLEGVVIHGISALQVVAGEVTGEVDDEVDGEVDGEVTGEVENRAEDETS